MSNGAKITLAVVLLVAAGSLYFLRTGNANDLANRTDFNAALRCQVCKASFNAQVEVAEDPPYGCEKCGKREAWPLWKCTSCGELFLPEVSGTPPRQPIAPACPKCKSLGTGTAPRV